MPAQGNALGFVKKKNKVLKGRRTVGAPFQGFVHVGRVSQGVALGWHVAGPLALKTIGSKVPCRFRFPFAPR